MAAYFSRQRDFSTTKQFLVFQAVLLSIVPQVSVGGVSWHMKTADHLNAMEALAHHMETFFRLLLLAHRRQNRSCNSDMCMAVLPPCRSCIF